MVSLTIERVINLYNSPFLAFSIIKIIGDNKLIKEKTQKLLTYAKEELVIFYKLADEYAKTQFDISDITQLEHKLSYLTEINIKIGLLKTYFSKIRFELLEQLNTEVSGIYKAPINDSIKILSAEIEVLKSSSYNFSEALNSLKILYKSRIDSRTKFE